MFTPICLACSSIGFLILLKTKFNSLLVEAAISLIDLLIFCSVIFSEGVYLYNEGSDILPDLDENSSEDRILSIASYLFCKAVSSFAGIIMFSFSRFFNINSPTSALFMIFPLSSVISIWFLSIVIKNENLLKSSDN